MTEFSGSSAAIGSLRFLLAHATDALKITVPWAALTTLIIMVRGSFDQPGGVSAALSDSLQVAGVNLIQIPHLAFLVGCMGEIVVSAGWIRFVLLAEKPSLFRFTRTGSYFLAVLQVVAAAAVAALPGGFLYLGMILLSPVLIVLGLILAPLGATFAYVRLCPMLPAAAIGGSGGETNIIDAFDMTSDTTMWKLAAGLVLTSLFSFLPLISIRTAIGLAIDATTSLAVLVALSFLAQLGALLVTCAIGGFLAKAYQALAQNEFGPPG